MKLRVFDSADVASSEAAKFIAAEARAAVSARGRFVLALSGGHSPVPMLRALASENVPWQAVQIVQVDERIAPSGHRDRNLTMQRESLLQHAPLPESHFYPMPVEEADLEAAARTYQRTLEQIAGTPAVLDLVHLGLGPDGHTASLVPNDAVLEITDRDVALTGMYMNRRRMTLTYPILNRSARILWLITEAEKAAMVTRLCQADPSVPAGRIRQENALLMTVRTAAR